MRWSSSASSRPVGAEQQRGLGLAEVPGFLEDRRDLGVGHELRPARSSQSNSAQTRFSSVGSRNTVEPFEPCRARLSAPFVPNTSRNRSTFSTVVVARIMTVLPSPNGSLRIRLPPTGSAGVGSFSGWAAGAASVDLPISAGYCRVATSDGQPASSTTWCLTAQRVAAARLGDADLRVDVLDVVLGGPRRDEQLRRDLAGGSAVGHEAQHLDLAPAQAAGPRLARPRARVAAGDVDLLARVDGRIAEVERRSRRRQLRGARLAELCG